jgi:membrane protein YqaA with SNARE-associated domain
MWWGSIIAVILGGLVGWWLGGTRATSAVNQQWMRALEEAKTDGIIDEQQSSDLIRIQDSHRRSR